MSEWICVLMGLGCFCGVVLIINVVRMLIDDALRIYRAGSLG